MAVTVEGGSMHLESVRHDGTVHDEFTIVKDVPAAADGGGGGGAGRRQRRRGRWRDGRRRRVRERGAADEVLALVALAASGAFRRLARRGR